MAGSLVVPAGVTGSFDPAANTIRVSPGNFPVGRSMTFTFDVDVGADAAGIDVANRATITYDGATLTELRNLTFSTRAATIAVVPSADLVVTKVNTPATVVAGERRDVHDHGPQRWTERREPTSTVTDELPGGVGGVTATASQGTCAVGVAS